LQTLKHINQALLGEQHDEPAGPAEDRADGHDDDLEHLDSWL
jgi:hypothetical protein